MFQDNKIFVLGMARSGYQVAKYLAKRGNKVVLNDSKGEDDQHKDQVQELRDLGVELVFGSHPDDILDHSYQYLVKNPGIPIDHQYVLKAKELGIEVLNEAEIAYRMLPDDVTLIGITGTNGKTTTTTLTYNILHEAFGDRVHLAGNIGYPLCSILDEIKKNDIIVMEVSCQQSENFIQFKPHIALITNYSPAHIDFLKTYENYKYVKSKMFRNQNENDIAILNIEDKEVMEELENISSHVKYFSSKQEINGCYLQDQAIYYYGDQVIDVDRIKIPGVHNLENCMAAIMVAMEFDVSKEVITKVIQDFVGVEHRLEYVNTIDGVRYYNDTEATNIKCTQIALSSFTNPTILILGGLERGQDFHELIPYMKNVKAIIAIGECRRRVLDFGNELSVNTYMFEYLKDGFQKIREIADDGDVVLLSPASASWDQYRECEIRGQEFKDLVNGLSN